MRGRALPALLLLCVAVPARAELPWQALLVKNEVVYEKRAVEGSKYSEYRATLTVARVPKAALDVIWNHLQAASPDHVGERQYLRHTDDEILVHDFIRSKVVSDREVTLRMWKERDPLALRFESRNDLGPPPTPGHVQLPAVRGRWLIEDDGGRSRLTFLCYSEPGGSVPAFMVRGALQSQVIRDVERVQSLLR